MHASYAMIELQNSSMRNWNFQLGLAVLFVSSIASAQTPSQAIELEQQGKLVEATEAWRAVTRKNPRDAAAFASLGVVLSKEQKYDEAAQAYGKALALNPKLPIQLNLGLAEFKQGRFSEAIAPFNKALEGDDNNLQARTLLGLSYYGAQKFTEAAHELQIASQAQPDNTELHHRSEEHTSELQSRLHL